MNAPSSLRVCVQQYVREADGVCSFDLVHAFRAAVTNT
jgi:hypothetical protein